MIIFDNMLLLTLKLSVADPNCNNEDVQAIRALNAKLAVDSRINFSLIISAAGIAICLKK